MTAGRPYTRREFLRFAVVAGATIGSGVGLGGLLAACGGAKTTATTEAVATSSPITAATASTTTVAAVHLEPVVVPTLPANIPGYGQVDPATGLHVTGTPTVVDPAGYRLVVSGKVAGELNLAYDDLRRLPKMTATTKTTCPGAFEDTTTRSGVPLPTILAMAAVRSDAKQIKLTGADGHWSMLDLNKALQPENFLAYEWMGQTLPVLQGFPVRAVIPGQIGTISVKWLLRIDVE
jgi:DMSO/TMAO reductase YedYZ molybdopterin-dependent catalytic subunit